MRCYELPLRGGVIPELTWFVPDPKRLFVFLRSAFKNELLMSPGRGPLRV